MPAARSLSSRLVIVTVGGESGAVVAFDQATGRLVWQSERDRISPSSPMLIDVDGETQFVAFLYDRVVGLDPRTGATCWSHPARHRFRPECVDAGLGAGTTCSLLSSAYNGGTRALKLERTRGGNDARASCGSPTACACTSPPRCSSTACCAGRAAISDRRRSPPSTSRRGAVVWRQRSVGRVTGAARAERRAAARRRRTAAARGCEA